MRRSVTTVTPAATDPVTLAEAKLWAKIDTDDDDPLLTSLVSAATLAAENYTRRALITQTLKLSLDLDGCGTDLGDGVYDLPVTALYGDLPRLIRLPKHPVQSITSVVTYDLTNASATFDPSNYTLNNGRLVLNFGSVWPSGLRPTGACEITYAAGYGDTASDVPQPIRSAILMHVQKMYDDRLVCDLPPSCETLLRQYRVMDGL